MFGPRCSCCPLIERYLMYCWYSYRYCANGDSSKSNFQWDSLGICVFLAVDVDNTLSSIAKKRRVTWLGEATPHFMTQHTSRYFAIKVKLLSLIGYANPGEFCQEMPNWDWYWTESTVCIWIFSQLSCRYLIWWQDGLQLMICDRSSGKRHYYEVTTLVYGN